MEAERAGAPFATGAILTLIPMWLIGMKLTHE